MAISKDWHDGFSKFFEAPTRDTLRDFLKYSSGEADSFDFKETWPDKTKLAKHVLALANYGGGAIIVGVKDTGELESSGLTLDQKQDKTDIAKSIKSYLPHSLAYDILDFDYGADSEYKKLQSKSFQVLMVEDKVEDVPYLCVQNGDGIKSNVIYTRTRKESTEADHHQVQDIIQRRLASRAGTVVNTVFQADLDQLRMLYKEGQQFARPMSIFDNELLGRLDAISGKDDRFSERTHSKFIAQLIALKQRKLSDSVE